MAANENVYVLDTGLPTQRELIKQLIDVRQREEVLKQEISRLTAENAALRARPPVSPVQSAVKLERSKREDFLLEEIERLRAEIRRIEAEAKRGSDPELRKQLKHAQQELATKKQRNLLSDEEWAAIREMRGQCS